MDNDAITSSVHTHPQRKHFFKDFDTVFECYLILDSYIGSYMSKDALKDLPFRGRTGEGKDLDRRGLISHPTRLKPLTRRIRPIFS